MGLPRQLNDVFYSQNLSRIAFGGGIDHSQPDFPQSTKARRVKCPAAGIEPGKKLVVAFYIFLPGVALTKPERNIGVAPAFRTRV